MSIFNILSLIGGLSLFLFGMNYMGSSLERLGGGKFESVLEKMTNIRIKGLLLGAGVTAVIQSSSAVTVMAVGFVNSKIMTLSQVIGIIMGANIGTTITSWLLSLTGIESSNIFIRHYSVPLLQARKKEEYRLNSAWFFCSDVRNGGNEQCSGTA